MKRLLLILVLMFISSSAFSQTISQVARIIIVENGITLPISNGVEDGVICYIKSTDSYYFNKLGNGWSLMNPTSSLGGTVDTLELLLSKQNAEANYTKLTDMRLSDARMPITHTHAESEVTNLTTDLLTKQATLVSGTNIKTVNGNSLLGSGDITISGGGNGYCLNVRAASQSTTTDGQTLYWGGMLVAPSTTANRWRVYIPKSGTIKAVYIYSYAGTAGTAETWVMNIRRNNSADTQIASVAVATNDRVWSNTSLSISVVAGDYIEIKEVCPTWATNPATVTRTGQIYIE